jgi:hypothetical protein
VGINKSADKQYFIELQNSFTQTATSLSATVKKYNTKLDPSLGVSLVNDAISAGAKGISINVHAQTIGPAIAAGWDFSYRVGSILNPSYRLTNLLYILGPRPVQLESRQRLDLVLIELQEHSVLVCITHRRKGNGHILLSPQVPFSHY